jgi:hypothetical protein
MRIVHLKNVETCKKNVSKNNCRMRESPKTCKKNYVEEVLAKQREFQA